MIAKKYRLDRRSFWEVRQTGKPFRNTQASGYLRLKTSPQARFAVVVSTQVAKRAVDRNQLRRRVYQILSARISDSLMDMIIYPKAVMLKLTDEEISAVVAQSVSSQP